MTIASTPLAGDGRLRFVFDERVIEIGLPSGTTFGGIAELWEAAQRARGHTPVAIDVTFGASCRPALPDFATGALRSARPPHAQSAWRN